MTIVTKMMISLRSNSGVCFLTSRSRCRVTLSFALGKRPSDACHVTEDFATQFFPDCQGSCDVAVTYGELASNGLEQRNGVPPVTSSLRVLRMGKLNSAGQRLL